MTDYSINICHLYPDLLNLYGDRGNIQTLVKRCSWRNINVNLLEVELKDTIPFEDVDILFIGGGSDREQLLVCNRLKEIKKEFKNYVEQNGVTIAVCGGYQLLGHYYKLVNETIEGLCVLDIYTEMGNKRLIGNVIIEQTINGKATKIVGFENHGGRTYINNHKPLGKVLYGYGNNGSDKKEGVRYKNVFGTYLHGPLLPKNPELSDLIITEALKNKYNDFNELPELDNTVELKAKNYVINRFLAK